MFTRVWFSVLILFRQISWEPDENLYQLFKCYQEILVQYGTRVMKICKLSTKIKNEEVDISVLQGSLWTSLRILLQFSVLMITILVLIFISLDFESSPQWKLFSVLGKLFF